MTNQEFAGLVQRFRRGCGGQFGALAFECFLLCSERPRSMPELGALTGASPGRLLWAVRTLTPWFNRQQEEIIIPRMHLLNRKKIPNTLTYRISLTQSGRDLLQGA